MGDGYGDPATLRDGRSVSPLSNTGSLRGTGDQVMQYCAQPSCSTLVKKGRCSKHATRMDVARGTAQQRGYDSQWATYSKAFRAQHPLCGQRADDSMDTIHSRCAQQ